MDDDDFGSRGGGVGWMHGDLGWGGWLVIVILLLLLAVLVIAILVALLRPLTGHGLPGAAGAGGGAPAPTEAEQLLDERYARGEIDEIEYLHRRAVLRGG
jgi:putative membrane protein